MTTTTDTDTTVTFTAAAVQTLQRMNAHVARLGNCYGQQSEEHTRAARSLAHAIATLVGLGGRISVDGDLSLFGASFISYGVVFHRAPVPQKFRQLPGAPEPGEWSVHS